MLLVYQRHYKGTFIHIRKQEYWSEIVVDNVISYSIPQGDQLRYNVRFLDETYDGQNQNGILKG